MMGEPHIQHTPRMKQNNYRIVSFVRFRTVIVLIILIVISFSQLISGATSFLSGALRLQRTADALLFSGEQVVAAAALLGENGILAEDPASLSNGGCALCNAGRDLNNAFTILYASDEGCEWEEAANEVTILLTHPPTDTTLFSSFNMPSITSYNTYPTGFYPAAGELRNAGSSLHYCELPLTNAGNYLDAASQVTGCIVMAAAASDDLIATGNALVEAGSMIINYGQLMLNGGGKVENDAGRLTKEAGASLILAGEDFMAYGAFIGQGKAN